MIFRGGGYERFMPLVSGYAKAFEDTASPTHRLFSTSLRLASGSSRKGYEGANRSFPKCTSAGCRRQIELKQVSK